LSTSLYVSSPSTTFVSILIPFFHMDEFWPQKWNEKPSIWVSVQPCLLCDYFLYISLPMYVLPPLPLLSSTYNSHFSYISNLMISFPTLFMLLSENLSFFWTL
jgi:hypothetical protein